MPEVSSLFFMYVSSFFGESRPFPGEQSSLRPVAGLEDALDECVEDELAYEQEERHFPACGESSSLVR